MLNFVGSEDTERIVPALIADDVPENRDLLMIQLQKYPLSLVSVGSGDEVISLVKSQEFKIVFLDLHMPPYGGRQLLDSVLENSPHSRVVVTSVLDQELFSDLSKQPIDFLPKPYRRSITTEIVERLLSGVCSRHKQVAIGRGNLELQQALKKARTVIGQRLEMLWQSLDNADLEMFRVEIHRFAGLSAFFSIDLHDKAHELEKQVPLLSVDEIRLRLKLIEALAENLEEPV